MSAPRDLPELLATIIGASQALIYTDQRSPRAEHEINYAINRLRDANRAIRRAIDLEAAYPPENQAAELRIRDIIEERATLREKDDE
jgi:hypothetical protein